VPRLIAVLAIAVAGAVQADDVTYDSALAIGNSLADEIAGIAIDAFGNIYAVGDFSGTVDFNPGPGFANVQAINDSVFLLKLDSGGGLVWVEIAMDSEETVDLQAIRTDAAGNLYLIGQFTGTLGFGPGGPPLTGPGGEDIFVGKFNSEGSQLWVKAMGGTLDDAGLGIATDAFGNTYTTGQFQGTADFDPGIGTFELTSVGSTDIFVQKLDTDGELLWAKAIGGEGDDSGSDIASDPAGNAYITGAFADTVDFDPALPEQLRTSVGATDAFVLMLDAAGNFNWVETDGDSGNDHGISVTTNSDANVYTAGNVSGDISIAKRNETGTVEWSKTPGGTGDDSAQTITVDSQGNTYTAGYFEDTVDFSAGAATEILTSEGSTDTFITKHDSTGTLLWARAFQGAGENDASDIHLSADQSIVIAGQFASTTDFDPSDATAALTSNGATDIFIAKLTQQTETLGDPNGDGLINSTDALWIIQSEFGLRDLLPLETCDLNNDGLCNSTDALWAIQIEFGLRDAP